MRCMSASQAKKRVTCPTIDRPREGSRGRLLYDTLMAAKGRPVVLSLNNHGDGRRMQALEDYYGLDIRRLQNGSSRTGRQSIYVLAGEWFGKVYVDYIAEHLNGSEQEPAS